MAKRYDLQRCLNQDRAQFSGLDVNVQFNVIAQCMFDISETLALIYDELCEKRTTSELDAE